jgi:histidinol-phosphatase (PHP family)
VSDYHLHLFPHYPSRDGPPPGKIPPGWIESYVETAAGRGITELGFTEHLYRCVEAAPILGRFWENERRTDLALHSQGFIIPEQEVSLAAYVRAVESAKDRGLPVKLGLEVDFWPDKIEAVLELLEPYPFDFLIGSIHWIGGWSYDSIEVAYEWDRRGIEHGWNQYFELETQLAESGAVDVLAHADVCKKLGFRPETEPVHLYEGVVAAAAGTGTAVEISSQGLRNPIGEVYPAPTFLKMFKEAGVSITLASDAHRPEEAGWGHEEAVAAARAAGYTHYLRFDRRSRTEHPLPA